MPPAQPSWSSRNDSAMHRLSLSKGVRAVRATVAPPSRLRNTTPLEPHAHTDWPKWALA